MGLNTDDIVIEITGLKSISKFIGLEDTPLYYDNGKFFKVEDNKIIYTDIEWKDISGNIEDASEMIELIKQLIKKISEDVIYLHNIDENAHPYIQNIIQENYTTLDTKIDNTKNELSQDIEDLNIALDEEIDDRETADNLLDGKIDNLSDNLQQETLDRIENDTLLQNNINSLSSDLQDEVTARISADNNLSDSIDDISDALVDEVSNRQNADSNLQTQIDGLSITVDNNYNTLDNKIDNHTSNTSNPHEVTKAQVGLGNADNTSDADKPISTATQSALDLISGDISSVSGNLSAHVNNTNNPHSVTKAQVGLGNCDNTSDANKPISTAQQTALDGKVDKLTTQPTADTYTKVTINSQGQVTDGTTLSESDIPSLHLTKISDVTATANEVNILDGATLSTTELNILDGATLSTTELNYVDGVTSSIQNQIDGKQPTITGGATTITSSDLTTARVLVSDNNGKVAVSGITTNELDYLDNISSNIQTQFNNITDLIPSATTTSNQLADKDFVNSSISTNTANFIGTFTSVSDLNSYSGTVTNNDYAFVINGVITDNGNDWATFNDLDTYNKDLLTNFDYAWVINGSNFDLYRFDILNQEWDLRVQNTQKSSVTLNNAYNRYKATVVSNVVTWDFEYTLNNSSFTAEQWLAINSGITATTKVTHTANTAIGSTTQPVYINANGETVAISNTIAKSVPSDAKFTDTTYTIATGSANGTISVSVDGGTASDVSVKGLGSAAYTQSTDYATASQGSKADTAIQSVTTGSTNGTISVDGTDVSVYGLGSSAYTDSTAYATSTQGGKADSAIQSVKVNGSTLTPDANKAVDVPVPVESTISGWGFTKNTGTVTSVNNVSPINGDVSLAIPTVNNATLTITQGGVSKGTFTANASSDVTIALDSGGGGTWGSITGTLSDQTDLQNVLNDKVEYSMVITDYTA